MSASPERLRFFRSMAERAVARGYYDHTPFWDGQAERGYLHPTARRSIFQVGRGGIKSGTGLDFAATELVAGRWNVPPGERHYFAWVSENIEEAAQRPRQLEAKLRAIGVPCERVGNTVEIDGLPLGFKAFPCRIGAVSGFRCIGFVCDEEAKWRNADDGANPAREVIASLRAMTVTHRDAREWHISSPLSKLDYHYEQFAEGDSDVQIVAHAATWEANPGITEEQTRQLERDARIWAREYAATPQDAVSAAFEQDAVLGAFEKFPEGYVPSSWVCLVDPSGGGNDPWSYALAAWCQGPRVPEFLTEKKYAGHGVEYEEYVRDEHGQPIANPYFAKAHRPPRLRIGVYGQIEAARARGVTLETIVRNLVRQFCIPNRVRLIVGDQFEAFALASIVPRLGLAYRSFAWTNPEKVSAVRRVGSWLRDGVLSIANDCVHTKEFQRQLLSFDEKITRSGAVTYAGRGTSHDDLTALCLLAARADDEALIPSSPYAGRPRVSRADVLAQLGARFGGGVDLGPGPNGATDGRWLTEPLMFSRK